VGGIGMSGGDMTLNTHVHVWTDAGWAVADPSKPPFNQDYITKGVPPYNNSLWQACKQLQQHTGQEVYFVLSGKGATPISEWAPGHEQWTNLDSRMHAAMATPELAGKTAPDYFFWYHGGSDSASTTYTHDFLDLRDRAIQSGWLHDDTKVIYEPMHFDREPNEDIYNMIGSGNYPWLHTADNSGIPYYNNDRHPTGDGCVTYGERIYEAAIETVQHLNHLFGATHFDFGSSLSETLYGQDNTLVRAQEGDDRIEAHGGGSHLFAGQGDDVFVLSNVTGETWVDGAAGYDKLHVVLDTGETYTQTSDTITLSNGAHIHMTDVDFLKFWPS
jgi:hypothetical protein